MDIEQVDEIDQKINRSLRILSVEEKANLL